MAMTAEVKDELSRLVVNSVSARRAEVASLLRFAGGLHIVSGRVVVEAEVDLGIIARRLRKDIFDLYGYTAVVHVLSASGIRKSTRYVVRVAKDGEALARQTGLLDLRGRPVRGLPAQVVGGSVGDAEAAWRGAFLAHGSLTEPGRSSALEVSCPGPGGGAGTRRCRASARRQREGARGARRRPCRGARRRGHRRVADPDGRPGHQADVGRAPDAARGAGDRQPAGQLRRRQPASVGEGRGGRGGQGGAGAGDPRRHRAGPSGRRGQAARRAPAGVARGARPAGRPGDDERCCRGPYSAAAVDGRSQGQARRHSPTPSRPSPRICSTTPSSRYAGG